MAVSIIPYIKCTHDVFIGQFVSLKQYVSHALTHEEFDSVYTGQNVIALSVISRLFAAPKLAKHVVRTTTTTKTTTTTLFHSPVTHVHVYDILRVGLFTSMILSALVDLLF